MKQQQQQQHSPESPEKLKQDVDKVHILIEHCLQLYMSKSQVVEHLVNAEVEPKLVKLVPLVFRKLEEENSLFFKEYNTRLQIRLQIETFNSLLEEQRRALAKQSTSQFATASLAVDSFQNSSCNELDLTFMDTHGDGRDSLASLGNMTRIVSLSDISAELGPNGNFPRSLSLSDFNFASDDFGFMNSETDAYLRTPERDEFDDELL